jgi:hypothetical protein
MFELLIYRPKQRLLENSFGNFNPEWLLPTAELVTAWFSVSGSG